MVSVQFIKKQSQPEYQANLAHIPSYSFLPALHGGKQCRVDMYSQKDGSVHCIRLGEQL
jgi:hypothetical protein